MIYLNDICDICGSDKEALGDDQVCSVCKKTSIKKEVAVKHPDSGLKLSELKAKASRLINCQSYDIKKYSDTGFDLSKSQEVVKLGNEILSGKATKAKLLDLITLNSIASRFINSQRNK